MSIYLGTKKVSVNPDPSQYATKEELNQRASVNADNFTSTGKHNIISFAMPDYNSGVSRSFATTYTETKDGWIFVNATQRYDCQLTIGSKSFYVIGTTSTDYSKVNTMMFPIPKGTSYSCGNQTGGSTKLVPELIFYPCKGA